MTIDELKKGEHTDLWRRGITLFGAKALEAEMRSMAQILLKAA